MFDHPAAIRSRSTFPKKPAPERACQRPPGKAGKRERALGTGGWRAQIFSYHRSRYRRLAVNSGNLLGLPFDDLPAALRIFDSEMNFVAGHLALVVQLHLVILKFHFDGEGHI